MNTKTNIEGKTNIKDKVKTDDGDLKNNDLKTTSNNTLLANLHFNYILIFGSRSADTLLSGPHLAKNPVPD